jgi:hypothetical protein
MNQPHLHPVSFEFPYSLYSLDEYQLAYHSLARWSYLVNSKDRLIPDDIADKIEDLIEILKYINDFSPSEDYEVQGQLQNQA